MHRGGCATRGELRSPGQPRAGGCPYAQGSDPSRLGEGRGRSEDGQPDFKRSPAFGPVVAGDLSLVVLDHTIRRTQSETGAFADWFGGVEGIENALGIAQAGAVVGELHDHFVALAPQANLETPAAGFL